jgi:hypothetical protein
MHTQFNPESGFRLLIIGGDYTLTIKKNGAYAPFFLLHEFICSAD